MLPVWHDHTHVSLQLSHARARISKIEFALHNWATFAYYQLCHLVIRSIASQTSPPCSWAFAWTSRKQTTHLCLSFCRDCIKMVYGERQYTFPYCTALHGILCMDYGTQRIDTDRWWFTLVTGWLAPNLKSWQKKLLKRNILRASMWFVCTNHLIV